ncbi:transcriptional regulator [Corynebacterium yudongzhengii]|uniref:XRE family transcriptional regulator n=1 Tax=Corynebacterium yudongzhengii TaxID=2080740 RepID=A0A2U1T5G9_9CORY|nr:helix-turn-helix transcriptional regulator [Corynebacterium yudongzhengii]AWB82947.1 transcriptional regulator [Corynebacterium yudongzhengii]PWC01195.1 XRE family transcriptional regulator [Corynebacterium yudongzhengii]
MTTKTALLDNAATTTATPRHSPMLLRQALGTTLRMFRADKSVTLRELAEAASVSPGYLSELERGRKEVSSELLASICHALEASVSEVLFEAASTMALPSVEDELANTAPAAAE